MVTLTPNGYLLDFVEADLVVNFFCEYPCSTCDNVVKNQCLSCYGGTSDFIFFHEDICWEDCPGGYTNTTSNNCTDCLAPCATCRGSTSTCTSCLDGFSIVESTGACREQVFWPFPFATLGFLSFLVILISEIITKRESRFKEAFIAFLAIPEVMSWCTVITFMYFRMGFIGPTSIAALALLTYMMINFAHAIMHPRQIIPDALVSYKQLF